MKWAWHASDAALVQHFPTGAFSSSHNTSNMQAQPVCTEQ